MVLPILDLINPGKFWASAENEEDATFHLVIPGPNYTAERLTANPTVSAADQLMPPFSVPHTKLDSDGRAVLDLKASGRAQEILKKLDQRFEQGMPAVTTARAIVVVTARKGNRVPAKQLAAIQDFTLPAVPMMSVRAVRDFVSVNLFKQGQREFLVDVLAQTLNEVEIWASNGATIHVDGGPSGTRVKVPIPGGRRFRVRVPVPLSMRQERQVTNHPITWYRRTPWKWHAWTEVKEREIWTGGDVTLTVVGRGGREITQSVKLRAESWASAWLDRSKPRVLLHNHC